MIVENQATKQLEMRGVRDLVDKLTALGAKVEVESGLGTNCGHLDEDYENVGAIVSAERHRAETG